MDAPRLTYLTVDSILEGAGASQVLPYLLGLTTLGLQVDLHSFEKGPIPPPSAERLAAQGITWVPHRFGLPGPAGGLERMLRGAVVARRAQLVHARGTLPAASAYLGARCPWVWDMRGFWTDARITVGAVRPGSVVEAALRQLERGAVKSAGAVVVLSERARAVLGQQYGDPLARKTRTIPTCVDLSRFALAKMPATPPYRLLLSGSLSARYDLSTMRTFVQAVGSDEPAELTALVPKTSLRQAELERMGAHVLHPTQGEIPERVAEHHAGLCVLMASPADVASMPTKVAEFLATGRPVVVSAGIGDLDSLLGRYASGVTIESFGTSGIAEAARQLRGLLADPELPLRCRALAEDHFDLGSGVGELLQIYQQLSRER